MPPNRNQSSARLLAPVALVAFALAVSLVVLASGGKNEGESPNGSGKAETATGQRTTATSPARPAAPRPADRSTYTVKPGDTLGKIAEKVRIEVEVLQELNPAVDPQALVTGQKLKLRE